MKPQTTTQILRSFTLGRYTAAVVGEELQVQGPQPLTGPLPASIKARREELITLLEERCGGVWPPAAGSDLREVLQEEATVTVVEAEPQRFGGLGARLRKIRDELRAEREEEAREQ